MSRAHRLLLAAYPPSFRERYGDELDALLDETGTGPREILDLLLGAVRAWLRPAYGGDPVLRRRERLLSTVSTLWVSWCVVVVGSMATLKVLEDRGTAPVAALETAAVQTLNEAAGDAILGTAGLVMLMAVPLGIGALRRSSRARRIAAGPVVAFVLVLLVPVLTVVYLDRHPENASARWMDLVGFAWAGLVAVTAAWWTLAMPRALRASAPSAATLRIPVALGPLLVIGSIAPAALVVTVVAATGTYWGHRVAVIGWCGTVVVLVAVVVGAVSAGRGLQALARQAPGLPEPDAGAPVPQ